MLGDQTVDCFGDPVFELVLEIALHCPEQILEVLGHSLALHVKLIY